MNKEQIYYTCQRVCRKLGVDESLASPERLRVEWRMNFTRRMGDAHGPTMTMRFSVPLFERASVNEQVTTVIHEFCHILDYKLYGKSGHGPTWKSLMVKCGLEPKRCHNIDNKDLKRRRVKFKAYCKCATPHEVGPVRKERMERGLRTYYCRRCKSTLKVGERFIAGAEPDYGELEW